MINPELDEFVQQELAQLSASGLHRAAVEPPVPQRLFQPADAAGVETLVRSRTLRALDWRLGWGDALSGYGVELVEDFLHQRQAATTDPLQEQFRRATLTNFNPSGSHFDGFVARLYECVEPPLPAPFPGYALGFSCVDLPVPTSAGAAGASMRLLAAIYEREQQLAIVQTLYQMCEDYFVSAVHRFGEHNSAELMTPCWDKFRQAVGAFMMRFRAPASCHEREWIALALARPHLAEDPIVFEPVDNRLVPLVQIDIGGLPASGRRTQPLDVIAIGAALPFESTREALAAFLRSNRMHGVAVVRTSSIATT
jgi:hypothetical protein